MINNFQIKSLIDKTFKENPVTQIDADFTYSGYKNWLEMKDHILYELLTALNLQTFKGELFTHIVCNFNLFAFLGRIGFTQTCIPFSEQKNNKEFQIMVEGTCYYYINNSFENMGSQSLLFTDCNKYNRLFEIVNC